MVPVHMAPAVPSSAPLGDASLTYDMTDKFAGTYRGIAGMFECRSTACSVGLNDDDMAVLADNNEVSFVPNNVADTYDKGDAAYTYFGWWLSKPKDNELDHDVEVFAGSTDGTAAELAAAMEGNAVYEGPAAGKYLTKSFSAGVQTDAGAGHFTATANLTAKLGEDMGDVGTISGLVSDFELDTGDTPAWRVTLEEVALTAASVFSGTTEVDFGAGPTSREEAGVGVYQGTFYDAAEDAEDAPGTVVGTFDAETDNGAVIGAFGAKKQ
jgi:hypothetical protein